MTYKLRTNKKISFGFHQKHANVQRHESVIVHVKNNEIHQNTELGEIPGLVKTEIQTHNPLCDFFYHNHQVQLQDRKKLLTLL